MTELDPNSLDKELKDGQNPNPENPNGGTGGDTTPPNTNPEGGQDIDYKKKFSESSAEALRLLEEGKKKDAEIERLRLLAEGNGENPADSVKNMFPGFEELDEQAQKNLINYTGMITERAKQDIFKDPAIAHAKTVYNENKFNTALAEILVEFPLLNETKDEFKKQYFNPNNTPDNIKSILSDLAKIHLFDKAKLIGAEDERTKANRIDLERTTGGDKTPTTSRTLADWQRMAQENPAEFAKNAKQYNEDLASGKLKE